MMSTVLQAAEDRAKPEFRDLDSKIQDLKQDVLDLNRDLFSLEEDLLFPANTQVAVFLSMDVGKFFSLDSVKLKVKRSTTRRLPTTCTRNAKWRHSYAVVCSVYI